MVAVPTKDPRETEKKLAARRAEEERRAAAIKRQRELFAALGEFVRTRQGFLISSPGELELRIDVLPGSPLVADLTQRGFQLRYCGTNSRATSSGFVETIVTRLRFRCEPWRGRARGMRSEAAAPFRLSRCPTGFA